MFQRCFLILILTVHAGFGSAQEVAPSIRPVLELVAYTNAYLKYCNFEEDIGDAQVIVDAALISLAKALHARAIAVGKKEEDVPKGVADFITLITREPPSLAEFRKQCPNDLSEPINTLKSTEFTSYLDDYISLPGTYDKQFALSDTDLETYAGPTTQRRLLDTIRSRMSPCGNLKFVSIETEGKSVDPPNNLPIFVAPTITFTEIWEVECDGQVQFFKMTHARDSEGPNGGYRVE